MIDSEDGVPNACQLEPDRVLALANRWASPRSLNACRPTQETPTVARMSPLRARVENGRLVLDQPTTLPDGTVVDLVVDDEGDDLTDQERQALHEVLSASWKSAESGHRRPASAILDELRQRG